jgi:hypothetical protein
MAVNAIEEAEKEKKEIEEQKNIIRKKKMVEEALHEFHINPRFADILHYIIEAKEEQMRTAVMDFQRELEILRNQRFKLREEIFDEVDNMVDKHFKRCY